jgi:hypothetical protein
MTLISRDQLEERYGKRHLSYSSIKYALGDMKLFDMYMRGELKKDSPALSFGTIYDDILFDRENSMKKYVIIDEAKILEEVGAKAKTHGKFKEKMAELKAAIKPDQKLISPEDWRVANAMIDRLVDCGLFEERFAGGDYQVEFNVELDGVPVKGFLDCLQTDSIIDSKSTKSIGSFKYSVYDFGYDIQAHIYTSVFGIPRFYWVAQEKTFPYLPADIQASDDVLFSGEMKFTTAVKNIHDFLNDEAKRSNPSVYFERFTI